MVEPLSKPRLASELSAGTASGVPVSGPTSALSVATRCSATPVFSRSVPAGAPSAEGSKRTTNVGSFVQAAVSRASGPDKATPLAVTLAGKLGATVSLSTTCSVPKATPARTFWSPARLSSASQREAVMTWLDAVSSAASQSPTCA